MKDIELFSRVGFLDKLLFTKHLSIMVQSGITVTDALDTLASQAKSKKFQNILLDIRKSVENGQSLGKALKKYPTIFDHFYTSLIDVSEESGTLEENLKFLSTQLAKEYALRKKIQGALLYPAIVLSAMTIIGIALSLFVLPKLVDLFSSLDIPLPLPTRILLFVAKLMKDHGIELFAGVFAVLIVIRLLIVHPRIQAIWHHVVLSLPLVGEFIENGQLATLFRNLGVMLQSGLTIKAALQVQYTITTNTVFKNYLKKLQQAVEKGKSLENELATGKYNRISPIAIRMIGVGEKTGKLDEIFLYLSDFFEEEVDTTAQNLTVILEPILLLIIGLIVGFVAIAIISPIYQLTGSIK